MNCPWRLAQLRRLMRLPALRPDIRLPGKIDAKRRFLLWRQSRCEIALENELSGQRAAGQQASAEMPSRFWFPISTGIRAPMGIVAAKVHSLTR